VPTKTEKLREKSQAREPVIDDIEDWVTHPCTKHLRKLCLENLQFHYSVRAERFLIDDAQRTHLDRAVAFAFEQAFQMVVSVIDEKIFEIIDINAGEKERGEQVGDISSGGSGTH